MKLTRTFKMGPKNFRTDTRTLELLRCLVPSAKKTGDFSAVVAVMVAGKQSGRIVEEEK
jgi:hypothetical protein